MSFYTWNGFMHQIGRICYKYFHFMDGPGGVVNALFIGFAAFVIVYWLTWQAKLDKEAEQGKSLK